MNKKAYIIFTIGLLLRFSPLFDILHEACHVMMFSMDGIQSVITSWSSTQPSAMSPGGLLGAYYIELLMYLGFYILLARTGARHFVFGIMIAISIKAPFSDDFTVLCSKYFGYDMVIGNTVKWIVYSLVILIGLKKAEKSCWSPNRRGLRIAKPRH